jgi:mannose/fructose/N-acetylgalactosamine-specific phosphotransferase system component IIB
MLKFVRALSLLALPVCAIAQQPQSPVRQIFVQDQRDRGVPYADNGQDMLSEAAAKNLPVVSGKDIFTHDAARRAQVATLLHDGMLKTAEDFREAAIIFQHGSTADDYLLAHVLAIEAMAKGDTRAREIAAVTLDRYLQSAGKQQIFGTQYLDARYAFTLQHLHDKDLDQEVKAIPDSKQTMEPYDRALLPDALRADFCVPPQQQQTDYITAVNSGKTAHLPGVEHCAP